MPHPKTVIHQRNPLQSATSKLFFQLRNVLAPNILPILLIRPHHVSNSDGNRRRRAAKRTKSVPYDREGLDGGLFGVFGRGLGIGNALLDLGFTMLDIDFTLLDAGYPLLDLLDLGNDLVEQFDDGIMSGHVAPASSRNVGVLVVVRVRIVLIGVERVATILATKGIRNSDGSGNGGKTISPGSVALVSARNSVRVFVVDRKSWAGATGVGLGRRLGSLGTRASRSREPRTS